MRRRAPWSLVLTLSTLALVGAAASAEAQEEDTHSSQGLDEEARALFTAGSTAFENARYEEALDYFRRAYELSGRSGLLYNIGISADRLRRDREALEAFEQFLEETPEHPRRRDVEVRVQVLRREVAEEEGTEPAPDAQSEPRPEPEVTPDAEAPGGPPGERVEGGGGTPVVLPILLGAAGVAGLVAAVAGIAASDDCLTDAAGTCVEERRPQWAPVAVYGGLGLAAVAGAVLWLVLGAGDGDAEEPVPTVSANGTGLDLGWTF